MSFNVGMNIVEVDGKATPSIQAAPTSVTGFIIKSARGIPGKVRRVTNWSQFKEYFGEYITDAYGAYTVRGFFDNGGQTALITRVVNSGDAGATAASITTSNGPWNLSNNDTISISVDGGATTEVVFVHAPASVSGAEGPFDLSTNNTIGFTVNAVSSDAYEIDESDADDLEVVTAEEMAVIINREFSGVKAFVSDVGLTVSTDKGDANASLSVTGTAAIELGLSVITPATGNVADIDNVTTNELVSIFSEAFTESNIAVSQSGQAVKLSHKIAGAQNTIQVQAGGAESSLGLDTEVHAGGDAAGAAGANASNVSLPTSAGDDALTVTAAYRGVEDRGGWGDEISVSVSKDEDAPERFDVIVKYKTAVVENFTDLSMQSTDDKKRFVEDIINDEFSGSKFIKVDAIGDVRPAETKTDGSPDYKTLENGTDGTYANPDDEANAYAAAVDLYDLVDIQLLCCPETHAAELVSKALAHCQNKGDRMFAGHTPSEMEAANIRDAYSKDFQGDKVYGALYFPWIQINDPIGKRKWVPPIGHILGVYARTERERGIWKAPAGNAAKLNGALDVKFHINDTDHTSLVKKAGVNAVRFISGQGIIIDSSRTLSTNSLWLYVNVRLLFNFVKSSMVTGLRWVVQEPHNESLWNKVKFNSVTPFLMGLWRRGAFGPGTPDEVFTVKIDAENNTPANIQQGIFTCEIYFYPSRPAETIVLIVGQQEGAGSASEG